LPEYLTGGEPTLRLIRAELNHNLTAYTMRPFYDTHHCFDCSLRSLRIALGNPATSSSLADEKRVRSLLLSTPVRDPMFSRSDAQPRSSAYVIKLGANSAATTSGATASEPVDVDEVDTYVLIAGQGADHRTQRSCGAA
jgi:hypothetical protein